MRAIGTMSGTSIDGVDVALIETDGERILSLGPSGYRPYSDSERATLRQALAEAVHLTAREQRPGVLAAAEQLVTEAHAQAVARFVGDHALVWQDIDVVAFHGQTVLHRPADRLTVQIGDGAALARSLRMPVVSDLRAADIAAGGQGAPLVPVYHRALVRALGRDGPVVVVNIGGVSNITYIDGDDLIACDTGPGNALLDDFMQRMTGASVDRDGAAAARGMVDEAWIARALALPFFAAPPPKSLDRNDFAHLQLPTLSCDDGAATLTALTAGSIALVANKLPKRPLSWIVAGGGANNPTMMRMLAERVRLAQVERAADLGWAGDVIEAQAFGFLAVRSLKGLPLTFPATTGVPVPLTGGVLAKP
jgi:anhydro-N-acetylmuramic acid kinase